LDDLRYPPSTEEGSRVSSAVDHPRVGALGRASDAQLTSLVRLGNQEAFAALYERHQALVNVVARASSRERAEDIAQEAWTSAYRALSEPGKPIDHVGPWLATITRNVARDRHRRDMRQPEIANDDIVAAAPAPGGVESALEGKHNLGRLLGAFDELSDEQRVILNLREFGGLTYKQIAEQLGKPESTIEAALFRARRKMAKEYAELNSGRRCRIAQTQLLTARQLSHGERRRLTRHLGRCSSCERVARLEGAEHLIPAPRLARIAGTFPVPAVVARLVASGADAVGPLVGKAAVAAVAVVAAGGGLMLAEHDGGGPATRPAGSGSVVAAAGTTPPPAVLSAAPNVVRPHRVAPVAKRTPAGVRPTTTAGAAIPAAADATPSAPAATQPAPTRRVSSTPVRRAPQSTAPRQTAQAPAQPTTGAAPQVTGAVGSTPAPVAQPVQQPTAPAPQPVQQPVSTPPPTVSAPTTGQGPRVTQTATCLVASCSIGG
jgi:RNA polymerase sigma factor (sigma-70 family)